MTSPRRGRPPEPPASLPTLAATAWRLVDLGAAAAPGVAFDQKVDPVVRALVEGEPYLDPTVATDALEESNRRAPDLGSMATLLIDALLTLEAGEVRAAPHPAWPLLCRLLDMDLLVPAYLVQLGRGPSRGVEVPQWSLPVRAARSHFERARHGPVAELHAHLGGAVPSGVLWAQQLVESAARGVQPLPTSADWFPLPAEALSTWRELHLLLDGIHPPLAHPMESGEGPTASPTDIRKWNGQRMVLPGVQDLAERILGPPTGAPWPYLDNQSDTLARILAPERLLVWHAWRAVFLGVDGAAPILERYLQVRNAFHKGLLSDPGSRGLQRFRRAFSRRWIQLEATEHSPQLASRAAHAERSRIACALTAFLGDRGEAPEDTLDVELRVSPLSKATAQRRWAARLAGIADALVDPAGARARCAFVVHLLKPPLVASAEPHAAPSLPTREMRALIRTLEAQPCWRSLIVGIDAAGEELSAPPRSFAAAFHLARLWENQNPAPVQAGGTTRARLGFTFHAGEDFRDLLTGIRHVDEAAHLLAMVPEDRLGHATAIAWRASEWYHNPWRTPRLDDHLLDLLWAEALLREGSGDDQRLARQARMRLERLLSQHGFRCTSGRVERIVDELDLDNVRHCPDPREHTRLLDDSTEPFAPGEIPLSEAELLAMLRPPDTTAFNRLVSIDLWAGDWVVLVERCRRRVVERLARRSLVIEANPTSNLVVGGLRAYEELPYLRVEDGRPRGFEGLAFCICTDDPAVFQTSLWGEAVRVGQALVAQGMSHDAVADWLAERRRTGVRASFIPKDLPRGAELASWIRDALQS